MKTMHLHLPLKTALLAGLLGSLSMVNSLGQFTFTSGSDGSYGALNITTNTTLAMPANGIFNCTTITIASNAALKFIPNPLNTPVYLLAQSNVVINGTIEVNGSLGTATRGGPGGPGGFAGGSQATELFRQAMDLDRVLDTQHRELVVLALAVMARAAAVTMRTPTTALLTVAPCCFPWLEGRGAGALPALRALVAAGRCSSHRAHALRWAGQSWP